MMHSANVRGQVTGVISQALTIPTARSGCSLLHLQATLLLAQLGILLLKAYSEGKVERKPLFPLWSLAQLRALETPNSTGSLESLWPGNAQLPKTSSPATR